MKNSERRTFTPALHPEGVNRLPVGKVLSVRKWHDVIVKSFIISMRHISFLSKFWKQGITGRPWSIHCINMALKNEENSPACDRQTNWSILWLLRPVSRGKWVPENPRRFYVIAGATYVYLPAWSSIQLELIDGIFPHRDFQFTGMNHDIGLFRVTIMCIYI